MAGCLLVGGGWGGEQVQKEMDRPHLLLMQLLPNAVGLDALAPPALAERLRANNCAAMREVPDTHRLL